ncbi:hypothetical protein ACLI4R_04295 [Natrialbaceae archaeon A-chndr2]
MSTLSRPVSVYLQGGVAALGAIVVLVSLVGFGLILSSMPPSESGFAEGLAILLFGLYVLAGFVILAGGLLIPQRDAHGIAFTSQQRTLLTYGLLAPIVGVALVPLGAMFVPPALDPLRPALVVGLGVFLCSGPLATLVAIGLKLRDSRHNETS